LNQPLNTIRVITDGILFGRDEGWDFNEGEIFESMEMITKQVMRMSAVIQNIRNFSREEREETFIDINANHAIENVLSMIGRQFEAHNISLHANLEFNLPFIKASLNRLEQVVMNLLVNARQALDSCQCHEKHLWIKTGSNENYLFIEVADNANGIPAENMERIFDPFFTTKEVGHGTGLGLTISRSIVKEFKGDIEAHNNPLGGATFIIRLPVQRGSR
jgi:histidine kinase